MIVLRSIFGGFVAETALTSKRHDVAASLQSMKIAINSRKANIKTERTSLFEDLWRRQVGAFRQAAHNRGDRFLRFFVFTGPFQRVIQVKGLPLS